MSLFEKIAQLFMIPLRSNLDQTLAFIEEIPVGGVIFFSGTIEEQRKAASQLQAKSVLPLLIGQDNEWGLSMRLQDALRFPRNLTLGAIEDTHLIFQLGKEIARQCKGVGVHVNFAPVVDINNNALNPVINDRSFGELEREVSLRSLLLMKGMQEEGILACAKHFPGHGDTHQDSHHTLPVLTKTIEQLEACELKPFELLIQNGLQAIMPAHLFFPLICDTQPTTLSESFLTTLLKEKLHFKGLVFTDSLEMKAIHGALPKGEAELYALKAGNDILVCSSHIPEAIRRIEKALLEGDFTKEELDEKVLKILRAKETLIKNNLLLPDTQINLFSKEAKDLKQKLFEHALTLVCSPHTQRFDPNKKTACVQIGRDFPIKDSLKISKLPLNEQRPQSPPPFCQKFLQVCHASYFFLPKSASDEELQSVLKQLEAFEQVIVGVYEMNKYEALNQGICPSTIAFIHALNPQKLWLTLFGSPYALKHFKPLHYLLMAYENDRDAQLAAAEVLLGRKKARGKLPITACSMYPQGCGIGGNQKECGS